MIIDRIYETQNLLSLYLVSFLVWLRTYQHTLILMKFRKCVCVKMFILYQRFITLKALPDTFGQVLNECKVSVWLNVE